jgi:mRNA-degrading endonuclease RelE of RelBE toxin-antitoxin system
MRYRVEFTTRAARALEYLDHDYCYQWSNAVDSPGAAEWFNALEEAVLTLERFPRRCPVAPESRAAKRSLRHLLYGKKANVNRLIHEIDEQSKAVRVLTIRHGARATAGSGEL